MPAGAAGGQVTVQLLETGLGLHHALLQAPHIRFRAGNLCRQGGFLPTKLQILLRNALSAGGEGGQLLLAFCKLRPFFFQLFLNFRHPLLGLPDLGGNAAAAILLTLELLLNPGDIGAVIIHIALQNRHLTIQLLVGGTEHIGF